MNNRFILVILLASFALSIAFAQDTVSQNEEGDEIISQDEISMEVSELDLESPSGGNEIVETVEVEEEKKSGEAVSEKKGKKKLLDIRTTGNKFGVMLGMNLYLTESPSLLSLYFVEIPFAPMFSARFAVGFNTHTVSSYKDSDYYIDVSGGEGKLEYLQIRGGVKLNIDRLTIGMGVIFDAFMNGSYSVVSSNTTTAQSNMGSSLAETVIIHESPNLVNLFVSAGYIAEINDNLLLMPEADLFVLRFWPWTTTDEMALLTETEQSIEKRERFSFSIRLAFGLKI